MPSGKFIILRAKRFRESDLILDTLSKEGEKVSLKAMNALKSKRRFAGGLLEPINFVQLEFTISKVGNFIVQEGRVIHGFPKLRENYNKLQVAFHLLQLTQKGSQEGLDNRELFDLLGNSLKQLELSDSPQLLKLQFELKYLFYLGFLAPNKDTSEFVSKPVSEHESIDLTNDEYQYLTQVAAQSLKQVEII